MVSSGTLPLLQRVTHDWIKGTIHPRDESIHGNMPGLLLTGRLGRDDTSDSTRRYHLHLRPDSKQLLLGFLFLNH